MKRKWNWPIWVGFVVVVAGLFSYEFFARFPITRDFPWANLLLFGIGVALLIVGLFRAFGRPQVYRGKIFGSIFAAIAVLVVAFFSYAIFYVLRQVPASAGAPRVGQKAPDFLLLDQNGKPVGLGDLLSRTIGTEGGRADFLSRFLVTAMQLRVAEFSATGFRSSRRVAFALSASASIRRILTSGNRKSWVHVSAAVRSECEGYSPIRCLASRGGTERSGHCAPSRISP